MVALLTFLGDQVAEQGRSDCVHAGTSSLVTSKTWGSGICSRGPTQDVVWNSDVPGCATHEMKLNANLI